MARRVSYDLENISIDGVRIVGIESFDADINIPSDKISVMGTGYIGAVPQSEIAKSFNFSMYTCSGEEDILRKIGEPVTMVYSYRTNPNSENSKAWEAASSYITSYELSCGVGELAKSSFSLDGVGAVDTQTETGTINESGNIVVARPGDVRINTSSDIESGNFLQSFSYKVEIPISKRNVIGGKFVPDVDFFDPISVAVDFELVLQDMSGIVPSDIFCEDGFEAVFTLENCGSPVRELRISNARMTSCKVNGGVGDAATISLSYQSYKNGISELLEDLIYEEPIPVIPYIVDFEGENETKLSYNVGSLNLGGYDWELNEVLIGTSASDKKNGARSARFSLNGGGQIALIASDDHASGYEGGLAQVSFLYAGYGGDKLGRDLYVEYSLDGDNWTQIGQTIIGPYPLSLTQWSGSPESPIEENVFMRIRRKTGEPLNNSRINIDDITIIGAHS